MKNPSKSVVCLFLPWVCKGFAAYLSVFFLVCSGCDRQEDVAEQFEEFREIVATPVETQLSETPLGTATVAAQETTPVQTAQQV
ncbi:MAG: hypothetical protein BROFUL_02045 [Candidatus Brocadia fulgida]|uniref:Uncharacterized protein n=1 Tax=Candidatus Brocadia fulgida TaxID=380242 RepID=A0A0M2UUF8_9BACT|nr:MAG: hypothetical protein BROFUL_02045 [Candidatus Brocadia fulgida]